MFDVSLAEEADNTCRGKACRSENCGDPIPKEGAATGEKASASVCSGHAQAEEGSRAS